MINQKEKNYASFILYYDSSIILSVKQFNELETWISSYFEYYELILVNNSILSAHELKQILQPTSNDIMFVDMGRVHIQDHALRAGIEFSKGDSIFIITDGSIPDLIPQLQLMYEEHKNGTDIIVLSACYSKFRHRALLKLVNYVSEEEILVQHEFIFLISKRVLNAYTLTSSKILPLRVLLQITGYKTKAIEYKTNKNVLLSKNEYTLYMMMFSDLLPRIAFLISSTCFMVSILGIIYAVYIHLFKQDIAPGWTTLFLLISFGLTGIFGILSIIVRYLGMLGKEIQHGPIYRVKQITKL